MDKIEIEETAFATDFWYKGIYNGIHEFTIYDSEFEGQSVIWNSVDGLLEHNENIEEVEQQIIQKYKE